jgi:hypothetical protein
MEPFSTTARARARTGRNVRALVALVLLLILAVAGCASNVPDPQPNPTRASTGASPTSPNPSVTNEGTSRGVSLVAVGDITCDPASPYILVAGLCQYEQVAKRVGKLVEQGADWFVPLGDIQYETGALQAFQQVYDKYFGRFAEITQPIAGNHEWNTEGASGYFQYFGDRAGTAQTPWRTFEPAPGWQVLLLDSNCEFVGGCGPDSPQGRWIEKTLSASTASCVVAAWHHPLRSSGEYSGDPNSTSRAEQLWSLVDAGGADVVLNGHDHIYERFQKFDGIQQFTVGTGGKNHYDITAATPGSLKVINDRYGVLLLTMYPDQRYSFEFVATDGEILDRGSETCSNQPG